MRSLIDRVKSWFRKDESITIECMGWDVLPKRETDVTTTIRFCKKRLSEENVHRVMSQLDNAEVAGDIQLKGGDGSGVASYSEYCANHCPGKCLRRDSHALSQAH